jgi:hypothetical protein
MELKRIKELINQNRVAEARFELEKLKKLDKVPTGVYLEWAKLVSTTSFTYLAIQAAEKEIELHDHLEAKEFAFNLRQKLISTRENASEEYPAIHLFGFLTQGSEQDWSICVESLKFQYNKNVFLTLFSESDARLSLMPNFVTIQKINSNQSINNNADRARILEKAFSNSPGEVISFIDNPTAMFSEHGLALVAATFKNLSHVFVLQTERLTYGFDGIAAPLRLEFPRWSQSMLLDILNLQDPSVFFSWKGVFFRKDVLVKVGLPFSSELLQALAYDLAAKIIRISPIHTLRAPVILDQTKTIARSYQAPIAEISDAVLIIEREKKLFPDGFSEQIPDIVEIGEKRYSQDKLPNVAKFILQHGENSAPKITVVTTVFNDRLYIERCLDSVISQNYPNLEYIVIDGGSTDGTAEIIKKHQRHLSYWHSAPDAGQYSAIQAGFSRSSGSIMTWINSDDLLTPYSLRLVASLFTERKEISWITGSICMTSEVEDLEIGKIMNYQGAVYFEDAFDLPYVQQEGTFWRRTLWEQAGASLDLRMKLAADMELWTRFFQHAQLYSISAPLGIFMRRKGQRSAVYLNKYHHEAYKVIERLKANAVKPYIQKETEMAMILIPTE